MFYWLTSTLKVRLDRFSAWKAIQIEIMTNKNALILHTDSAKTMTFKLIPSLIMKPNFSNLSKLELEKKIFWFSLFFKITEEEKVDDPNFIIGQVCFILNAQPNPNLQQTLTCCLLHRRVQYNCLLWSPTNISRSFQDISWHISR